LTFKTLYNERSRKVAEIIVDEAQDLTYDILKRIKSLGNIVSYGADFNQKLYERRVTEDQLEELFSDNTIYNLQLNFRNTYHILNFVKSVLPDFYIAQESLNLLLNGDQSRNIDNKIGIKPILSIVNKRNDEIDKIIKIINSFEDTHNIAILLPFGHNMFQNNKFQYASARNYYNMLSEKNIACSLYYNEMNTDNIKISHVHVTTYKSAKGLEFDTVIIPCFERFESYKHRDTFPSVVNEEDYYVAFTRARLNLYLFSTEKLDFISENICDITNVHNLNDNHQKFLDCLG